MRNRSAVNISTTLGPAVVNSLAGRRMRVRTVQFLDPAMANVPSELHGRMSTHADSLSHQYQCYF